MMWKLVLIVSLLAVVNANKLAVGFFEAVPVKAKNDPFDTEGYIIGGYEIGIRDAPYQASLLLNGNHACGASIISPMHVITAAHCTTGANNNVFLWKIRVGSTSHNTGGKVYEVRTIINHPNFNRTTLDYDFALIQLKTPILMSADVSIVKLPPNNGAIMYPTDEIAFASGWGTYGYENSAAKNPLKLQGVELQVIARQDCISAGYKKFTDRMMCVYSLDGNAGTCFGDSGGPLVLKKVTVVNSRLNRTENVLVGLVSYGPTVNNVCRTEYPSVFALVSYVRDWIKKIAFV